MATRTRTVGAFDVRYFIAVALGLIGVYLLVVAAVDSTPAELEKTGGLHANLWTGIVMVVVAAVFAVWAWRRPMEAPTDIAAAAAAARAGMAPPDGPTEAAPGAGPVPPTG